jgi:hypothetical protein
MQQLRLTDYLGSKRSLAWGGQTAGEFIPDL